MWGGGGGGHVPSTSDPFPQCFKKQQHKQKQTNKKQTKPNNNNKNHYIKALVTHSQSRSTALGNCILVNIRHQLGHDCCSGPSLPNVVKMSISHCFQMLVFSSETDITSLPTPPGRIPIHSLEAHS